MTQCLIDPTDSRCLLSHRNATQSYDLRDEIHCSWQALQDGVLHWDWLDTRARHDVLTIHETTYSGRLMNAGNGVASLASIAMQTGDQVNWDCDDDDDSSDRRRSDRRWAGWRLCLVV